MLSTYCHLLWYPESTIQLNEINGYEIANFDNHVILATHVDPSKMSRPILKNLKWQERLIIYYFPALYAINNEQYDNLGLGKWWYLVT